MIGIFPPYPIRARMSLKDEFINGDHRTKNNQVSRLDVGMMAKADPSIIDFSTGAGEENKAPFNDFDALLDGIQCDGIVLEIDHFSSIEDCYPPYLLLDEEDYMDLTAPLRLLVKKWQRSAYHLIFFFPKNAEWIATTSRPPSRSQTPCRQSKVKEMLGRIDDRLSGHRENATNNDEDSLEYRSGIGTKYRYLLEMVSGECVDSALKADLMALISDQTPSNSKWVTVFAFQVIYLRLTT